MNKKAFTLMEILLTIAVLAVVVTSIIPYFFKDAKEILEENKRVNMFTAYQNARTGANMLISITTAKAKPISGNLDCLSNDGEVKSLENYSPKVSRVFEGKNGNKFVFGAKATKNTIGKDICIMTYVAGEDPTLEGIQISVPDATDYVVTEALNDLWETVFAGEGQQ